MSHLLLNTLNTLFDQMTLHPPRIVSCRDYTMMGRLVTEGTFPMFVTGDVVAMVSLTEICETWCKSKREDLGFGMSTRGQNPAELDEIIHVHPSQIVIRYSEL